MAAYEEIDKIEEISKVGEGSSSKKIAGEPEVERVAPNPDHFQSLMQQSRSPQPQVPAHAAQEVEGVQKTTIFDEVRKLNQNVNQASRVSPKDLAMQAEGLISQIEQVKDKLKTPDLNLKGSYQTLLQNKLTHIDENLRIALSKAGVEYKVPEVQPKSSNPIDRFLGFLTDGQYQLQHLSKDLEGIANQRGQISPASMLAIQVKVTFITQELEFFTSVLNKALESTKTIMNVQV
jgi:hypothetical protein